MPRENDVKDIKVPNDLKDLKIFEALVVRC